MTTYHVTARRWERGWEFDIDGVGVTQSRTLTGAETMVRDYLSLDFGAPPESFDIEIHPDLGGLEDEAAVVRSDVRDIAERQRQAAVRSRDLARRLKSKGLTGRDVAAVLGVSPQRVSQLLRRAHSG